MDKAMARHTSDAVLAVLAQHYKGGVVVREGNGRFDRTSLTIRIKITPGGSVEEAKATAGEEAQQVFARYAASEGLQASDFGKLFSANGEDFRIAGYNTRARTRPILGERVRDGKMYIFRTGSLRLLIDNHPGNKAAAPQAKPSKAKKLAPGVRVMMTFAETGDTGWYAGTVVKLMPSGKWKITCDDGEIVFALLANVRVI